MNIVEATKEAMSKGVGISRESWHFGSDVFAIIPTNTTLNCIFYSVPFDRKSPRWNPSADDLTADDWELAY